MKILAVIFLCSNFWLQIFSARILGVLHIPTSSHNKIGIILLKSLAERGHQVTILSGLDPKLNNSNVTYIYLDGALEALSKYNYDFTYASLKNTFSYYILVNQLANALTENVLKSNAMKKLLNSEKQFDIVFIEPFFNQALMGLGQHFNAQTIVLSTSSNFLANLLFKNIDPYSFVPNGLSSYTDKMNFQERLSNTIQYVIYYTISSIYNKPVQEKLYKKYFPQALDYNKAIKNVSLHFVNTHVIYESPRPYLPNMIPIGGLHVQPPKKLPKGIQDFLDSAKQGAIFFSLGSFIQSKDISTETKIAILNTFSKLPQKVLWKFEDDLLEIPENVKISKWFPQNDVLAHPNLKLFITHGGQLSSIEAIYNRVPILGIPFFFDQYSNTLRFTASGCGQTLLFPYLTEETFTAKIQQILNNSSYSENIAKASRIVRDQPETPLERAIFWTEHISKYGSSHLRPASLDLNFMEYLLLDILIFVVLFILFICLVIYFVVNIVMTNISKEKHIKKE